MTGGERTYVVKRGETLHGIAKRLSGSTDPAEVAGFTQSLSRANGHLPAGLQKEGAILVVPGAFPDKPKVGFAHGSREDMTLRYQHREEIADSAERLYAECEALRNSRDFWLGLSLALGFGLAVALVALAVL